MVLGAEGSFCSSAASESTFSIYQHLTQLPIFIHDSTFPPIKLSDIECSVENQNNKKRHMLSNKMTSIVLPAHIIKLSTFVDPIPHINFQEGHFQTEATPNTKAGPKGDELELVQII